MPAQAVLFDVDGTLIDSVDLHAQAWQEALAKFGCRATFEEVRHQIGKGGDQLMPVFLSEDRVAVVGEELERYRGEIWSEKYMKRVWAFPGVRKLFQALRRRGIRIALASSAKEDELAVYKQLLEVEDLIEDRAAATEVKKSKPHPDSFRAALQSLGKIPLEQVWVVGDTPWDAIAAHRLGVGTIGVLCGGFPEEDLRAAGCAAIYAGPEALLASLDDSPLVR